MTLDKSVIELKDTLQKIQEKDEILCLGGFLKDDSLYLTFADKNNDLVLISYEEDYNADGLLSLNDISGPFEKGTKPAEGVIDINLYEAMAFYTIACLILEVLKLKVDRHKLMEFLLGVRVIDLRKDK